jgi:hypothetical protein
MKKLPAPLNRSDFLKDIKGFEQRSCGGINSLSHFFRKNVVNVWDLENLTDAEALTVIKSLRSQLAANAGLILDIKLSQSKRK